MVSGNMRILQERFAELKRRSRNERSVKTVDITSILVKQLIFESIERLIDRANIYLMVLNIN